jgi:methionyl aminopeptidase
LFKPGKTLGDIGHEIQIFAEKKNYSIVRDFCGHGLGKVFHDNPSVLHFGKPGEGEQLKEGMFFTVEPMVNIGDYKVKVLSDGWTAVTSDKSLSAQFEHTIGVTKNGYEIFTLSKKNHTHPPY